MRDEEPTCPRPCLDRYLAENYTDLSKSDANDVSLFGSQAMSVYTKRALASKDIDLIVPMITLRILEVLCDELQQISGKNWSTITL